MARCARSYYCSAARSVGVRDGHLHLHRGGTVAVTVLVLAWAGWRLAPCTLRLVPRMSPIDSNCARREQWAEGEWKVKWNRTSCPAGAGRALRNISAATSRGRPPGNDAGRQAGRLGAPRWAWRTCCLGDARPAGALDSSAGLSGRDTKRRADRVDTSTPGPTVRRPMSSLYTGSHPSSSAARAMWAGETVVPPPSAPSSAADQRHRKATLLVALGRKHRPAVMCPAQPSMPAAICRGCSWTHT